MKTFRLELLRLEELVERIWKDKR